MSSAFDIFLDVFSRHSSRTPGEGSFLLGQAGEILIENP